MPARIKPVNTASFRRQDDSSNFSKSKRPLRLLGRGMIMHREAIFLFQPLSVSFAVRVWAAHEPPKQSLIGTASLYCLIVILSEAKNLHTPPFAKWAGGIYTGCRTFPKNWLSLEQDVHLFAPG
jgi:hypothetical protein